jgi:hypothetical protein
LLRHELRGREHDVLIALRDVAQQLPGGPMMADLPNDVWQGQGKCDQSAEPDPFLGEMTALGGKQESNADAGGEESHGMFVLQAETNDRAKPQPKPGRTAIDNPDEQINEAHPKQRLKRVHRKEIADREKNERAKRSGAAERDCPTPSAKFARDHPGQGNVECARNRWKETNREK